MSEPLRAVLIDIEGVMAPMAFMTETLIPLAAQRLGSYIVEHAEDEVVEEALEETGRLMGGYELEPAQAESLLLRWMKQGRKATPLKILQGLVWEEAYEAGSLQGELYPDVSAALAAWAAAGLRLFVYSSNSAPAQKLLLTRCGSAEVTGRFEDFFDTSLGQKIEPGSYRDICERLGLPAASILLLSESEEELDAARTAGLATIRIARDGPVDSGHAVSPDLASLNIGQ
ncbi:MULTISPECIES: acireductone synthase [Methylosinus]|uniref:Acireductone synthase n=1 Tax=Methylosinus trichosporium (strain ATCC 35070 / NCIMB 11131 / UNIQEM 75 / OB3b) TaxID=595536 RepID=A0A2D2D4U5_METT3|nr:MULTISPECIES: acireductone synthase [Methylosinus]ATQ70028.1 acireductone synthase [Methylosinus trichosporium OB3b]OBS50411.1 2,3-diketo-5-methylthio-1-phosphopentane phosphatase [Methylosinus sp. 3S-1]